ncbi:MAG: ribokinase [Bacteroidetes bacterium]|nr:ribokinase [Bacteroidota bacterium]MBS1973615.1 ribokinase [Bacteroidota bacterium]
MRGKKILVVGSSNTDMVIKTSALPAPGETILGGKFFMNAGGKGANQAVAAARLGGNVTFIAKTGDDFFGRQAIDLFKKEAIDTSHIIADSTNHSGVALITVNESGENCIVVAPGANEYLSHLDIQKATQAVEKASIMLVQLEIPIDTVAYVVNLGASKNKTIILNPAPANTLSNELLKKISIITPNQKEAEMLTGIKITDKKSAEQASLVLHRKGVGTVIITMGAKGAFFSGDEKNGLVSAPEVQAVDSTAAGDVFNGALAVALSEGMELEEATRFSCKAAALSVTRLGAQDSSPYRHEII